MKAYISNIQRFSINDGPGIRTTVFFQGCPLQCSWCQNPECISLDANSHEAREYTPKELLVELLKDKLFFEESGGGVTFSGGEPLMQTEFLMETCRLCKENNINTAIDTSGYHSSGIPEQLLKQTDLILYDLKIMDNTRHKEYTGVENKIILQNLKELDKHNTNLIIRLPLIPGITDTSENIRSIIAFIKSLNNKYPLTLLPYHNMASGKYERLNLDFNHKQLKTQTSEEIKRIKLQFINHDISLYENE